LLREHCEAQIKDGQPTGGSLLELTSKLAELARAEKVFELLSERVLKLQTEERAPLGVSLLKRAEVPTSPAEASPLRKMGLAALAALCLPFVLATFWERFVGRVSEPNQLQRETRVSVVGEVAELPDHRAHNGASLSRRTLGKLQVFEESVDGLRTALLLSDDLRELRVIAVTSAASHEGKTSLAVSLALSVARASGQPTLLVDGDLRAPSVHRLFDAPLEPGLAEVLRGERRLEEAIVPAADGAVHVLPAGKLTASPHALLGSGPLAAVLRELSARYRYVIIDTPPILGGAEALLLAKIADGCLLCALRNSSRGDEVRKACEQLATAGTRLIGAVLNGVPSRRYDYRKGPYYGAGTPCG
jgi:capsular exopolysaccharide synthesis family protein